MDDYRINFQVDMTLRSINIPGKLCYRTFGPSYMKNPIGPASISKKAGVSGVQRELRSMKVDVGHDRLTKCYNTKIN